jgi:coenzyme F420 hydrogenase subunit beta
LASESTEKKPEPQQFPKLGFEDRMRLVTLPKDSLGFGELKYNVTDKGTCCRCGACVAVCPVNVLDIDHVDSGVPVNTGKCITCSLCTWVCTGINKWEGPIEKPIGEYIDIFVATDPSKGERVQDGGVTTGLVQYALKKGIIDGAVLVDRDENWVTEPKIVTSPDEVPKYGSSTYWLVPLFPQVTKAITDLHLSKLAVVDVPCGIATARWVERIPKYRGKIALKIGLFCYESYYREEFMEHVVEIAKTAPEHIKKIDIKKGKMVIVNDRGENMGADLEEFSKYTWDSCWTCHDLTGEWSDITVGAIGNPKEGTNVVIVRTEVGRKFIEQALADGVILRLPDKVKIKTLSKIAARKKQRSMPPEVESKIGMSVYERPDDVNPLEAFFIPFMVTIKQLARKPVTVEYPKVRLNPSERFMGRHRLDMDLCTGCSICARVCIDSSIEMVRTETGKEFPSVDMATCSFCGLCVDYCPRYAITMTKEFELSGYNRHEMWYTPIQLSDTKEEESYGKEIFPTPHRNVEVSVPLVASDASED